MDSQYADAEQQSPKRSLFAWPPHRGLTGFHLLSRSVLLLSNTVGVGLSFAAGSRGGRASGFAAGTYQAISLVFLPLLIVWNTRMLRNPQGRKRLGYDQLESDAADSPTKGFRGTKMLKFATIMDMLGLVVSIIVYPIMVVDGVHLWYGGDIEFLFAYASVTALIALVIHLLLAVSQIGQLKSAKRMKRDARCLRCPHCHHTMQPLPVCTPSTSAADSDGGETRPMAEQANLLADSDGAENVVNMAPGQETGTCTRTPRLSASGEDGQRQRGRSGSQDCDPNETGEGEGDRLIEKSQ